MAAPLLLLSVVLFLLSGHATHAMRPAPFDREYKAEAPSGARLVSSNSGDGRYSTDGVTKVFGADGRPLYEMPVFTGRRNTTLSSDGSVVVMDGNVYFGTHVMRAPGEGFGDPVVTSVYLRGEPWKDVRYGADLNGGPIDRRTIRGGGWANRPFSLEVDWGRGVLVYDMDDAAENVEIPLPSSGRGPQLGDESSSLLYDNQFSM